MGYNRSGRRRTDRLKRHKRHQLRLMKKIAGQGDMTKAPSSTKSEPAAQAENAS